MTNYPFNHPPEWRPKHAEVRVGPVTLSSDLVIDLVIRSTVEGAAHRRFVTLELDLSDPSRLPIWDNRDRVTISVGGTNVFSGFIAESAFDLDAPRWFMLVRDGLQRLQELKLKTLGCVGLQRHEAIHFMVRLAGWSEEEIVGLSAVGPSRPFIFAVPLQNVTWSSSEAKPVCLLLGDLFVQCHDDVSQGLLEKASFPDGTSPVDAYPVWATGVPKLCGVVRASSFYEARIAALRRARIGLDFLSAASRLSQSTVIISDDTVQVGWNPRVNRARPRLSSWMYLRDRGTEQPRYLVFDADPVDGEFELDLDLAEPHLAATHPIFDQVVRHGGLVQSTGAPLDDRIMAQLDAYQRALRWLTTGRNEEIPTDAFLAFWFALETLLASRTYENLFEGPNKPVSDQLKRAIDKIVFPEGATIDREFLTSKLRRGDPFFRDKLAIFAEGVGVQLSDADADLVRQLNTVRGQSVHGATAEPTPDSLRRFEHIVERLLLAALANRTEVESDRQL